MEARSHTIVAMEKQYCGCLSVALVIQHAMRVCRITHIFICGVSGATIFFHIISYKALFSEKFY